MITHRRRITPDDGAATRYLRLPFDLRATDRSLEVRLSYDRGSAVIDLGCEGPDGWRGWSGGARQDFVIGAETATPGYLPGELEPGTWWVILGLYRIPEEGIDVDVRIETPARAAPAPDPDAPPVPADSPRGSARNLPSEPGLRWYAGDFHAHTLHSDGSLGIGQLAAHAAGCGLDFLAVTDHNTVSHHRHLPAAGRRHGIALVPGQEVTTDRGHANVLGDVGWIDFRRPAEEWLQRAEERGGVLSVNHPIYPHDPWRHDLGRPPHAVEAWHVSWFLDLTDRSALDYWRGLGGRPVILGGSDFHGPEQGWNPGTPTTWVAATGPTPEEILDGVRAGRTAVSLGVRPDRTVDPFGTPVLLAVGDELVAEAAEGLTFVDAAGRAERVTSARQRLSVDRVTAGPCVLSDDAGRVMALSLTPR